MMSKKKRYLVESSRQEHFYVLRWITSVVWYCMKWTLNVLLYFKSKTNPIFRGGNFVFIGGNYSCWLSDWTHTYLYGHTCIHLVIQTYLLTCMFADIRKGSKTCRQACTCVWTAGRISFLKTISLSCDYSTKPWTFVFFVEWKGLAKKEIYPLKIGINLVNIVYRIE